MFVVAGGDEQRLDLVDAPDARMGQHDTEPLQIGAAAVGDLAHHVHMVDLVAPHRIVHTALRFVKNFIGMPQKVRNVKARDVQQQVLALVEGVGQLLDVYPL